MKIFINYSEIEENIYKQLNEIRNSPILYIQKVKEAKNYFQDKIYKPPGEEPIETYEGNSIIEESISFLKTRRQALLLKKSEFIAKACKDHIEDIGQKGLTSHEGSDGKNITDRLEKYCEWDGVVSESMDFGFKGAENIILNLIFYDGLKNKINRMNLFSNKFKYVGIAVGFHKIYGICVVIGYAYNIRPIGSNPEDVSYFVNNYLENRNKDEESLNNTFSNPRKKRKSFHGFNEIKLKAPGSPVTMTVSKNVQKIKGKKRVLTKKTFVLEDGTNYIVEVEDEK